MHQKHRDALATEPGAQGSNVSSMYWSAAPWVPPLAAAWPLAAPPAGGGRRVTHTTMPQPHSVSPSRTFTYTANGHSGNCHVSLHVLTGQNLVLPVCHGLCNALGSSCLYCLLHHACLAVPCSAMHQALPNSSQTNCYMWRTRRPGRRKCSSFSGRSIACRMTASCCRMSCISTQYTTM